MITFSNIQEVQSIGLLPLNSVVNADCLEAMRYIKDKSIDMVLCDLPYGTTSCKWDIIIPFEPLWEQYKRIIKDNGAIVLTASQPFTSLLIMSNLDMFKYELIWHKNFSGGFILAKSRPMKYHENILVFYYKQPTYNPQFESYAKSVKDRFKKSGKVNCDNGIKNSLINNIQHIKKAQAFINYERGKYPSTVMSIKSDENANGKRIHPTQKPVSLFEYLIKTYTNDGDLVLDNCAGSGTTGVACANTNRNYILIEKDETYCSIIEKRISELPRLLITK